MDECCFEALIHFFSFFNGFIFLSSYGQKKFCKCFLHSFKHTGELTALEEIEKKKSSLLGKAGCLGISRLGRVEFPRHGKRKLSREDPGMAYCWWLRRTINRQSKQTGPHEKSVGPQYGTEAEKKMQDPKER